MIQAKTCKTKKPAAQTITDVVVHYQKSIKKAKNNPERLLHCIERLHLFPIKSEHIRSTGIGHTINSLKRLEGEVGVAAQKLLKKWKQMVVVDLFKDEPNVNIPERVKNKENTYGSTGATSSDNHSSSNKILPYVKNVQKRHNSTSNQSDSSHSNEPPVKKKKVTPTEEIVIDSSMGASFEDALGILDQPKKKSILLSKFTKKKKIPTPKKASPILDQPSTSKSSCNATSASLPQNLNTPSTSKDSLLKLKQSSDSDTTTSSVKSKTKVFSGFKLNLHAKIPKLFDLCLRWLIEHLDDVESIGGIPYYILKPVLERASVQQLLSIEDFNPYLIEDTDELWQMHCKRHFRGQQPEELESWRDLYLRAEDERKVKFAVLTKNIKEAHERPGVIKKTKLAIIETHMDHKKNRVKKIEPPKTMNTNTKQGKNCSLVAGSAKNKQALEPNNSEQEAALPPRRTVVKKYKEDPTPLPPKRRRPGVRIKEEDPEWLPGHHYTKNDRPKDKPRTRKTIDMIRYDRAKKEERRKERQKLRKVIEKDHSYSAPSTVPASPAAVAKDHDYPFTDDLYQQLSQLF